MASRKSDDERIRDQAEAWLRVERILEAGARRNPDVAAALAVRDDLRRLAMLLECDKRAGRQTGILRILIRRFGKLATYELVAAFQPKGDHPLRLHLGLRPTNDLSKNARRNSKFVKKQIENAAFLEEIMELRRTGLSPLASSESATQTFGRRLSWDAAQKVQTEASKQSRLRGYVNPVAPLLHFIAGHVQTRFKIADLPSRGRPRKKTD